jgi:TPP-dependent pyruvate/acetoin dehydrogenase alpha subunit
VRAVGFLGDGEGPEARFVQTMSVATHDLLEMYRLMLLSRYLERACAELNARWFPAEGEEAAIVGTFYGLRPDDVAAPHYRGPFVVYAMRGASLERLVAQALGKATGYAKGRAVPFTGPVSLNVTPWVAGDLGTSLGVATGAALSFRYDRDAPGGSCDRVVVVSFGDGTANRGDFHECINLAAVWDLPIVYVCQNNHYSISEHVSTYIRCASIADRAIGYGIPGRLVDGNDVVAVHEAVQEAVARARAGKGPSLIEARTYRLRGHWAEDPAHYRPPGELEEWLARDPLPRARRMLLERGVDAARLDELDRQVKRQVEAAVAAAQAMPDAGPAELGLADVFAPCTEEMR